MNKLKIGSIGVNKNFDDAKLCVITKIMNNIVFYHYLENPIYVFFCEDIDFWALM
jgi:hypothetical protein